MLYYPWYNEDVDLLGGYDTYEEHYLCVHHIIIANEKQYTYVDVNDLDYDFDRLTEHAWDQLAPSNEEGQLNSISVGNENLRDMSQDDLVANTCLLADTGNTIQSRYESSANANEIPANGYRKLMQQLLMINKRK